MPVKTRTYALLPISHLLSDGVSTLDTDIFPRRQRDWGNDLHISKDWSSSPLVPLIPSVADCRSIQKSFSCSEPDRNMDLPPAFQCCLLQCHPGYALRAGINPQTFPVLHFSFYPHIALFLPCVFAGNIILVMRHNSNKLFHICLRVYTLNVPLPAAFFFFFCHTAQNAGSSFPHQGPNLCSLQWQCRFFTTGLPGKSQCLPLEWENII